MKSGFKEIKMIESNLLELENFKIRKKAQNSIEVLLNNSEFLSLMKITKLTAYSWRRYGIIPFFKLGDEFYYCIEDIKDVFNENYIPSVKMRIRNKGPLLVKPLKK